MVIQNGQKIEYSDCEIIALPRTNSYSDPTGEGNYDIRHTPAIDNQGRSIPNYFKERYNLNLDESDSGINIQKGVFSEKEPSTVWIKTNEEKQESKVAENAENGQKNQGFENILNDSLAKADTLIEVIESRKTTDILNHGERDECREIVSQIASLVSQSKNDEVKVLFGDLKYLMEISDEITPNEYQSHISKLLESANTIKSGLQNILKKLGGEGELSTPDFNVTS